MEEETFFAAKLFSLQHFASKIDLFDLMHTDGYSTQPIIHQGLHSEMRSISPPLHCCSYSRE